MAKSIKSSNISYRLKVPLNIEITTLNIRELKGLAGFFHLRRYETLFTDKSVFFREHL
jgi:hypothetical protein